MLLNARQAGREADMPVDFLTTEQTERALLQS